MRIDPRIGRRVSQALVPSPRGMPRAALALLLLLPADVERRRCRVRSRTRSVTRSGQLVPMHGRAPAREIRGRARHGGQHRRGLPPVQSAPPPIIATAISRRVSRTRTAKRRGRALDHCEVARGGAPEARESATQPLDPSGTGANEVSRDSCSALTAPLRQLDVRLRRREPADVGERREDREVRVRRRSPDRRLTRSPQFRRAYRVTRRARSLGLGH